MDTRLLDWEIKWVRKNQHRFDSDQHVESVCSRIRERYMVKELKRLAKGLEQTGKTKYHHGLLNHIKEYF
jgi:hypothetical protein